MTFCIGLTGGISSGKSTVAKMFHHLGAEVICSDTIARALTARNQPALLDIKRHFGNDILLVNGELNRQKLREIIFHHPEERLWLEKLLHPLIRQALYAKAMQSKAPYCIIEIPLLYQKNDYPWLDRILVITTPEKIALERIMQRDQCSLTQAKAIIDVQNAQVNYVDLADDLIVNEGDLMMLEKQIARLHRVYMGK